MSAIDPTNSPNSDFEVRHRNPLAKDFLIVSRVVLLGYPQVSDGAKVTYWVVYGHDWYEVSRGGRKGYVYPTLGRLARMRRVDERTIRRHLAELIQAQLLTRELRPGKPSVLYIEESSDQEVSWYLDEFKAGADKDVRPPRTKLSAPFKKEKEKQEKPVNGDVEEVMEEVLPRPTGWNRIGDLLHRPQSVQSTEDQITWLASEMVKQTSDPGGQGCYLTIAQHCPEDIIFEALALLKEARSDGTMLRTKGGFLVSTLRRLCQARGLPDPLAKGEVSEYATPKVLWSRQNHGKHVEDAARSYKTSRPVAADSEAVERPTGAFPKGGEKSPR